MEATTISLFFIFFRDQIGVFAYFGVIEHTVGPYVCPHPTLILKFLSFIKYLFYKRRNNSYSFSHLVSYLLFLFCFIFLLLYVRSLLLLFYFFIHFVCLFVFVNFKKLLVKYFVFVIYSWKYSFFNYRLYFYDCLLFNGLAFGIGIDIDIGTSCNMEIVLFVSLLLVYMVCTVYIRKHSSEVKWMSQQRQFKCFTLMTFTIEMEKYAYSTIPEIPHKLYVCMGMCVQNAFQFFFYVFFLRLFQERICWI